jgi:tetratricopeptide (TPR) repeat protein
MCINFFNIVGFFQNFFGNFYFYTHQYSKAKDLFKKEKTSIWDFDLANALYKEWSFSEALKTYIALLWKEKTYLNFALNYNIWNTYYRLSEQKKDSKENQWFLEKALSHYNEALKIKSDWQTQKNIDFIKEKMKNIHQESQNAGEKQNSEN